MGYPPQGQDPYGQQQPYQDPYGQQPQYGQPQYGQPQPDPYAQPQQPAYQDPYAQPQQPAYQDPYAQQPPVSGTPYPTSGGGYPTSGGAYPPAGYGTPGYQQPGYGGQQPQNTLGLLALIFGILSVVLFCCIGVLAGPAAIVCGYLGQQKVKQGLANNGGMALAGMITGAVGTVLSIGYIILTLVSSNGFWYTY
ncbi:DUF4190 domain-containing protein [Dactylosporangium sp. NPDC000521]|uniref:DUF4190 domain-containing protein n=1 Tax=Dactylosporangium sp. NPDC000521 TaxID=3363975 RepID=UPI0036CAEAED